MQRNNLFFLYLPESSTDLIPVQDEKRWDPGLSYWGWNHVEQAPILAPSGTKQPKDKFDVNNNHSRKVLFESKLALAVLQDRRVFNSVLSKVNHYMNLYLQNTLMTQRLQGDAKMRLLQILVTTLKDYLYSKKPYFGRLTLGQYYTNADIINEVTDVLTTHNYGIHQILLTHMGMLALFKKLGKEGNSINKSYDKYFTQYLKELRPDTLFSNRGRATRENSSRQPTTSVGFEAQPTIMAPVQSHNRCIDTTERDVCNPSDFAAKAFLKEIPFVAGPSGSTAECLLSALMFSHGKLTKEELQLYTLCCVGFFVGAGAHSFHEVCTIANLVGVPYVPGNYEQMLPEAFKATIAYQQLLDEFPDIIQRELMAFDQEDVTKINEDEESEENMNEKGKEKEENKKDTIGIKGPLNQIPTNVTNSVTYTSSVSSFSFLSSGLAPWLSSDPANQGQVPMNHDGSQSVTGKRKQHPPVKIKPTVRPPTHRIKKDPSNNPRPHKRTRTC